MARMNNVDLIKLSADFSERAYGKRTDLLPSGWTPLRTIDVGSGYQAMVYVNRTTHEVFYANTGTNELKDTQAWTDAVFGPKSQQFNDMLFQSKLIDNEVKNGGALSIKDYTVYTTGHSWGELMGQAQTYTFGWTGAGFDGPGAGLVVSDARFSTMLQAQNLTAVGGTDFITVNTTGLGFLGGSTVGHLGDDISGTVGFDVTLPGSLQSGAFNIFTTAAGGVLLGVPGVVVGGLGGKVYTGVALHPMSGINRAIQAGQFVPAGVDNGASWWLTDSSSGVYFKDNKYNYDNPSAGVYVEWNASGAKWEYPDGNGGTIKIQQYADDSAVWSRLNAFGGIVERLLVDPAGTVTRSGGPTVTWSILSLDTGNLIGEVDEAGAPAAPTADPLASLLDSIRSSVFFEDQSLITASEIRALTGTQAAGETFGGTRLLEFSGDALSDYWNFTNSSSFTGTWDYFDGAVDYNLLPGDTTFSLGDSSPLLSMDYSGLGLLSGFGLGGDTDALLSYDYASQGNTTTTSFSTPSWEYSSNWYVVDGLSQSTSYTSTAAPSIDIFSLPDFDTWSSGSDDLFFYSSDTYYDTYYLPIALDLDGDGVELVSEQDSRAYYDVKGDGYRRNIGWVGADDAFLAIDKDGNGKIEQSDELSFALWTATPDDTDLEALKTVFDTNQDNTLDANDTQFSQLRVWQDANGDGVTDAGELKTLAEAGIVSLNLTAAQTDWASGGNHISGFTTYSKTDGTNGWAADVGLGYEADGWKTTVESNLVRVTQSGGLVYGLTQSGALNLDLGSQGMDGASNDWEWRMTA